VNLRPWLIGIIGGFVLASCAVHQVGISETAPRWSVSLPDLTTAGSPRSLDQRLHFQFRENGKIRKQTLRGRVELDARQLFMLLLTAEGIPVLQARLHDGKVTSHSYLASEWRFPPRHLIEAFTLIYWPTDQLIPLLSRDHWRLRVANDGSRQFYADKRLVVTIHYRGASRWTGEACMDDQRYQLQLCSKILE